MSKKPSIVKETSDVLKQAFEEGFHVSRHVDKANAKRDKTPYDTHTKKKIYDGNTFASTQKTCVAFVKFCREEFGTRHIADIKPEYFEKFIEKGMKIGSSYSAKTAATYQSEVKKLEEAYNKQTNSNIKLTTKDYKKHVDSGKQKQRVMMPSEIHDKIIEKAYKNARSKNGDALTIGRALGLRESEIMKIKKEDFKLDKQGTIEKVHVHKSKGGRSRNISMSDLSEHQVQKVELIYQKYEEKSMSGGGGGYFFDTKATSLERAFQRYRDSVTEGEYKQCGIHSMRKEWAREVYGNLLKEKIEEITQKKIEYEHENEPERDVTERMNYYERELEKTLEEKEYSILEKQKIIREVKEELTEDLGHNRVSVLNEYIRD